MEYIPHSKAEPLILALVTQQLNSVHEYNATDLVKSMTLDNQSKDSNKMVFHMPRKSHFQSVSNLRLVIETLSDNQIDDLIF